MYISKSNTLSAKKAKDKNITRGNNKIVAFDISC